MPSHAARIGDSHKCPKCKKGPLVAEGCSTVLLGNHPAARVGDVAECDGGQDEVVTGEATVLIGKQRAARIGDRTGNGGRVIMGMKTVWIGKEPPEVACLKDAASKGRDAAAIK